MRLIHRILSVAVCLCAVSVSHAARGIVFVHGTGVQTDARTDYWTGNFIDSITLALPDPSKHLVVNCDFETQYVYQAGAAGCLAQQL